MKRFLIFSEYGSEVTSQPVSKQHLERISEQILFQEQTKKFPNHNKSSETSSSGVFEYCNFPNPNSLKEDTGHYHKELGAHGYKLKLVQMMIRHGDRTPLHTLADRPNPRISCKFSKKEKHVHWIVGKFISRMQNEDANENFEFLHPYPNQPYCRQSYLTPQGAVQALLNGLKAKYKYVDQLDLFGQNFSERKIIVKSTVYPRTYQSANAFMFGFLSDFNAIVKIQKARTDLCSEKDSGLRCYCTGMEKYATPQRNMRKMSKSSIQAVTNFKRKVASIFHMDVTEIKSLTHVFDALMVRACHSLPYPCNKQRNSCVDRKMLDTLWSLISTDMQHNYFYNENLLKTHHLRFHPLLVEMYLRMKNVTKRSSRTNFVLYSGHDITMTPFLMLLGIFDGKWTPYASSLVLELYSKEEESKIHYYLKIIYNGADRTKDLKFCRGLEMCKFKYFEQFVNTHLRNMGLNDYLSECFS
ncbi:2-phosphoxylose phosphatase 1-like [Saccostrea cucullata]|uniref:2-phosphoxylose phosphatase 1-like n=1 Tax=Saccostrea cuccullata TaxID=36930 RepID=UPI002ED45E3A